MTESTVLPLSWLEPAPAQQRKMKWSSPFKGTLKSSRFLTPMQSVSAKCSPGTSSSIRPQTNSLLNTKTNQKKLPARGIDRESSSCIVGFVTEEVTNERN